MATDDEIRIVLNVLGQDKIDAARKAIEQEEDAIRKLDAALKAGSISADEFKSKSIQIAQGIKAANDQIRAVNAQLQGGGFKAGAILEFSRAVEDAQYGVAGVVNNIPGLVTALGGGPGLTGVLSLAAIAVNQLVKNWDGLMAALGQSKVLTEAEEMKKLGDETQRTADQEERYQKLKNREQRNQAQTGEPDNRSEIAKSIDEAVKNAPSEKVDQAIQIMYADEIKARIPKAVRNELDEKDRDLSGARQLFNSGQMSDAQLSAFSDARDRAKSAYDSAQAEAVRGKRLDLTSIDENGNPTRFDDFLSDLARRPEMGLFNPREIEGLRNAARPEADRKADDEDKNADKDLFNTREKERADREFKAAQEEEAQDRAAAEHAAALEREREQKLANWAAQAKQQRDNEDMTAMNADAMAARNRRITEQNRPAQIFYGARSLIDQIQTSGRLADASPTEVANLAASREIAANTKKMMERLENLRQGPARFS